MDVATEKNAQAWLDGAYDERTKAEIRRLAEENPKEFEDAFYKRLAFGTGGLRGIMGVGSNRLNTYTIGAATQGLANYLKAHVASPSVLIGYDSRHYSREFAQETAQVLASNGIKVYLYHELRPVPLVSFGLQHKQCSAGVMITASHNPREYNGYKVYWSDGAQVLPPHDTGIIDEVNKVTDPTQVTKSAFPHKLIEEIDGEVDKAYLETIRPLQLFPGDCGDLKIVYTPLHGAGITMVPRALEDWGYHNVTLVEQQKTPDGDFPTVNYPNPEEPEALTLGIETLKASGSDLLIATDPDVDRVAIVAMHQGKPVAFNGNEAACLALEHLCRALTEAKGWPPKPMFVKTIVTTELFRTIAEHHGAACLDVLTGFKYIGQKIAQWEEEKGAGVTTHHYIFGGEESYGCLYGTHARDKDAVITSCLLAEVALHQKRQGKTLVDLLEEIYRKYGIFREKLHSLTFPGKEGAEQMQAMMTQLREHPPHTIGEMAVVAVEDYLNRQTYYPESGKTEPLLLPKSNVLRFWLADETKLVVRPSGTEPKMKLYGACREKHHIENMDQAIARCDERVATYVQQLAHLLKG